MSDIAALYNVPGTPEELSQWAFAHAAHHVDINRVIFNTTGVALPSYVLDPIDPENTGVWSYQHQLMHQAQNAVLGIDGNDLLDVDFKNQNELAGFVQLNASEHYQAANALGIG